MWGVSCGFLEVLLILGVTAADLLYRSGRRVCSSGEHSGFVAVTQSFVQPVHTPLITLCEGRRVCSTYRTTYKISYRQVSKKTSVPLYTCCPGWRKTDAHSCNKASCRLPCQNGGTCVGYNRCQCAEGWSGNHCQTDVNECASGRHYCSQRCINTPGRYHCGCQGGFRLLGDGTSCHKVQEVTTAPPTPARPMVDGTGETETMRREMEELRSKIEVLEQKLQSVLAPFLSLSTASPEDVLGPVPFLVHSFQQLDRIDSLSEQIAFLEERLETCEYEAPRAKLQSVLAPFLSLSTASPEDVLGPVPFLVHSFQQLDRIDSLSEQIAFLEERLETCEYEAPRAKLQSVLAPFLSLSTASPEDVLGPVPFLVHSFQQLDRIDSLSEQIAFLEERLETCSCKNGA